MIDTRTIGKNLSNAWILEQLRLGRNYSAIANMAECTNVCIHLRAKKMRAECGVSSDFQMLEKFVAGMYVPSEGRKGSATNPRKPSEIPDGFKSIEAKPIEAKPVTVTPAVMAVAVEPKQVALSDLDCFPCKQRGHRCTAVRTVDREPWCKACAEGRTCEMFDIGRMQQRSVDLARYA